LYQDKEDRKKVNTNEGEAYKDSVRQLLDIYRNDKRRSKRQPCPIGFPKALTGNPEPIPSCFRDKAFEGRPGGDGPLAIQLGEDVTSKKSTGDLTLHFGIFVLLIIRLDNILL
jgi:hypothetical protein